MSDFHKAVQTVIEECLTNFGESGRLVFAAKTLEACGMLSEGMYETVARSVERGLQEIPGIEPAHQTSVHLALLLISDVFGAHGVAVTGVVPDEDGLYHGFEVAMSNVPGTAVQAGLVAAVEGMAVRLRATVEKRASEH